MIIVYDFVPLILILIATIVSIWKMDWRIPLAMIMVAIVSAVAPPPEFLTNQVSRLQERELGRFVKFELKSGFLASGGLVTTDAEVIQVFDGRFIANVGDKLEIKTDRTDRWQRSKLCNKSSGLCNSL